ncbi:TonB-dependent receptor [Emcibacter sp.]|uniref:TonB-dependent receptor n=1 Tax=Emcibacter sp. TaxID=1979954 RepID=UPI002AA6AE60|nr:TonB-dependent receptor [Emcibacter sp.]
MIFPKAGAVSLTGMILASSALFPVSTVVAQGMEFEEIVVRAQKRDQSLQDVPVAVTAFQASELEAFDFSDPGDIAAQTPNLQVSGAYQQAKPVFAMRGISFKSFNATDSQAVGVYSDEVYISSRSGQLFQMFDLERVEVLRGPQGTLFGKNTTGGAISFFAKRPGDEFAVDGSVTYGRFNQFDIEAGVSVPVVKDKLAARLSFVSNDRDGYTLNEYTGDKVNNRNNWAARALVVFTPGEGQEWVLNVHGGNSRASSSYYHSVGLAGGEDYFGYSENPDFQTLSSDIDALEKIENLGVSLNGTIDFDGFSLTSISAYEKTDYWTNEDSDASPNAIIDVIFSDYSEQFSQEVRLTSTTDGPLNWIVGAYYFTEDLEAHNDFNFTLFDGVSYQDYAQDTENFAVFGQAGYEISERLRATVGARWTYEKKTIDFDVLDRWVYTISGDLETLVSSDILDANAEAGIGPSRDNNWDAFTWRLGLDYDLTDNVLVYGSYNRGFKSGGYNGIVFNDGEFSVVDPEFVNAYEIGFKSTFLDRKLVLNVAAFYNEFSDLQLFNFTEGPGGIPVTRIVNAASAEAYGAEIEVTARPVEGLKIQLGLGLVDTKLKDVTADGLDGFEGNELALAPNINLSGVVDYRLELGGNAGTIIPRFEFNYVDDQYFDASNDPLNFQPGYWVLNAALSYEDADERYSLSVWVKNLADEEYLTESLPFADFGLYEQKHSEPRTYGVTFRFRY